MFTLLIYLLNITGSFGSEATRELPRLLQHRSGSHYFVRLNGKLSVFNYTTIFEYGFGYRINWDVKPFDEIGARREKRLALHRALEEELEKYGLEGHACLSRLFCEMETMSHYNDLITRIVKLFLRSHDVYTCPDTHTCPVSLAWVPYLLYQSTDKLQK